VSCVGLRFARRDREGRDPGYAENNAYTGVKIVPWSVTIEHKEVEFDTDKAIIRNSELPSLEDSLKKINRALDIVKDKELGTITLFIAGHTDTRGSQEHNLELSRRRAQAIATWFTKRGLCIPVAFEGFGENALKKKTADEVDEQENRRVDYILAVEPPMTKKESLRLGSGFPRAASVPRGERGLA